MDNSTSDEEDEEETNLCLMDDIEIEDPLSNLQTNPPSNVRLSTKLKKHTPITG